MKTITTMSLLWALLLCNVAMGAKHDKITVTLTVPDAAWTIDIDEIHTVKNELWVISTVSRDPDVMAAQVISTVQASADLAAPDLPVKHFVIGRTWGWENTEPYTFIKDLKQIEEDLRSGEVLYRKAKKDSTNQAIDRDKK